MFSFINIPGKIIGIMEANISPREIAFGICLAMFLGFTPMNGPMAILLWVLFFVFKINRVAMVLTLPIFKSIYMMGFSAVTEKAGAFLLERVDILTSFWKWTIGLPIVAYLDINNTLVAGGLAVAFALTIPVYIISSQVSRVLTAKYSQKIQDSAFAKWMSGIKVVSRVGGIIGPDKDSTVENLKADLKSTVVSKMKTAALKRAAKKPQSGIQKRINIKGIIIIIIVLAVFHFGVGLFASPMLSEMVIAQIDKYSAAKILVDKVNVWPLTLSFTIKGIKISDPDDLTKSIAKLDNVSAKISPLALLSKRLVFSAISIDGAEIDLEGASDGSFNIQHLGAAKAGGAAAIKIDPVMRHAMEKKDWFGKVYELVKGRYSKAAQEKVKAERLKSKKVTKVVESLPKGRLVHFKSASDLYIFEIKKLDIENAHINVKPYGGDSIEINKAMIRLGRLGYDPENGMKLEMASLKGDVTKSGAPSGGLDITFLKTYDKSGQNAVFNIELKEIDLDATRFIYGDSLPVDILKGKISLRSKTSIIGDNLDSRNALSMAGQKLQAKSGGNPLVGIVPVSAICDAINQVDPMQLKFDIKGTVDKPELGGFQASIMALAKPYIANIQERLKTEGMKALTGLFKSKGEQEPSAAGTGSDAGQSKDVQKAVDTFKALFGAKENK